MSDWHSNAVVVLLHRKEAVGLNPPAGWGISVWSQYCMFCISVLLWTLWLLPYSKDKLVMFIGDSKLVLTG